MAIITISRQFGAGGRTLSRMISKKLDYLYLDEAIIEEIAKKARVSKESVKSMERTAGGKLSKFFSIMLNQEYIDRLLGEERGYMDEALYFKLLREIILDLSSKGNVIIMGRGGQYILGDHKEAIHIYLVSDMQHKIEFMQRFYKVGAAKAKQMIDGGEKMRINFYSKFGKKNYDDPMLYDLVINRNKVSVEGTIDLICEYVKIHEKVTP